MILSKYLWGEACRAFPGFRDAPGVIRLAWALCDFHNDEIGCAWPTRETLAKALDAPPESVSRWLRALQEGGAITIMNLNRLPAETRSKIARSARRAQVYVINHSWAVEVLRLRDERAAERSGLRNQKVTALPPFDLKGGSAATPKGNGVATSKGGSADTLIPYSDPLDDTLKKQEGREGSKLGVYTREGSVPAANSYALAKGKAA